MMDRAQAIAWIKSELKPVEEGRKYQVEPFRPEHAQGVAKLFYAIYGEEYPIDDYYIPERIAAACASGNLRPVIARLESGEVVGQAALYRSSPPNPGLFEFGQMLIVPEYRNSFIAFKLMCYVRDVLTRGEGVSGVFGEAVCHHTTTQKMCDTFRMPQCGLELALMPESAYAKEGAAGRISCLLAARSDRDRPGELHLPQLWREPLEYILGGYSLERRVVIPDAAGPDPGPDPGPTRLREEYHAFAGVLRCHLEAAGHDFASSLARVEARIASDNLAVVQFFVNAGAPGAVHAANALIAQGYLFGGLIPIWFEQGDALLLQKLTVDPEFDKIKLHHDRSQRILEYVRADYVRATGIH